MDKSVRYVIYIVFFLCIAVINYGKACVCVEVSDRVLERFFANKMHFLVSDMEAVVTCLEPRRILLEFTLQDIWDRQNLECDIEAGMFLARFVSWLRERGVMVGIDSVHAYIMDITGRMATFSQLIELLNTTEEKMFNLLNTTNR